MNPEQSRANGPSQLLATLNPPVSFRQELTLFATGRLDAKFLPKLLEERTDSQRELGVFNQQTARKAEGFARPGAADLSLDELRSTSFTDRERGLLYHACVAAKEFLNGQIKTREEFLQTTGKLGDTLHQRSIIDRDRIRIAAFNLAARGLSYYAADLQVPAELPTWPTTCGKLGA